MLKFVRKKLKQKRAEKNEIDKSNKHEMEISFFRSFTSCSSIQLFLVYRYVCMNKISFWHIYRRIIIMYKYKFLL